MTLYGWRTTLKPSPEAVARGCSFSGWIHEANPPWRVIVFTEDSPLNRRSTPSELVVTVYDGDEETVMIDDLRTSSGVTK